MTLKKKIQEIVTIGDEASYHCIFIAGVPMYHGMDLELVTLHAERVKEAITEQLCGKPQ